VRDSGIEYRLRESRGSVSRCAIGVSAQLAQHFLIASRGQEEYRNHDIINTSRRTGSMYACTRYIMLHIRDSRRFNYDKSCARACTRAFIFLANSLNKSRETARGRIKRDRAGTLHYKEDAWREGFPALTSSLAIRLVRAPCNVRACLHA